MADYGLEKRERFPLLLSTVFVSSILVLLFLFSKRFGNGDRNAQPTTGEIVDKKYLDKVKSTLSRYINDVNFKSLVDRHSQKLAMPDASDFLLAMIAQESQAKDTAVGDSGRAIGLMQIHQPIAESYGYNHQDMYNPDKNLDTGTRFLRDLHRQYKGDWDKAINHYNSGGRLTATGYVNNVKNNQKAIRILKAS